jgi:23S rRNA A1618 N6-methylase RlmF
VKTLSLAILKVRYSLVLELPHDCLCPAVPVRANYLRFIAELVRDVSGHTICGVDVGTGASAIYALLGARVFGWQFVATEISDRSVEVARRNVELNGLSDKIEVRKSSDSSLVFVGVLRPSERFDFTVCNPPFFSDSSEACSNPRHACTASVHEAAMEGGEQSLVAQMIRESAANQSQSTWWTSMLGRKASLKPLVA